MRRHLWPIYVLVALGAVAAYFYFANVPLEELATIRRAKPFNRSQLVGTLP